MTSQGRWGNEYVTIAMQKRQTIRCYNHKIPWVQKNANIESDSWIPVTIITKAMLGQWYKLSEKSMPKPKPTRK